MTIYALVACTMMYAAGRCAEWEEIVTTQRQDDCLEYAYNAAHAADRYNVTEHRLVKIYALACIPVKQQEEKTPNDDVRPAVR